MTDRSSVLTDHLRRTADRPTRIQAVLELLARLDIGAKVKTNKSGDTVITIPAKAGK